jgi:hypothetical protein
VECEFWYCFSEFGLSFSLDSISIVYFRSTFSLKMPKVKTTLSQRKAVWIRDLKLGTYVKLDGSKFVCQVSHVFKH